MSNAKLANLKDFEMITLQTEAGAVIVQKLQHGAEAWTQNENVPANEVGVFCMTAQEAFEHQFAAAKRHSQAEETPKRNILELKAKVTEILNSKHVSSVEVGLDEETASARYYTATTQNGQHRYRVTVRDESDATTATCNCAAGSVGMLCRHAVKVAEFDSKYMNREIQPEVISTYRAYKSYQRQAA